jgi:hypothetical protein
VTMSRPKIRCSGCRKRIPDHEPDVVLCRLEGVSAATTTPDASERRWNWWRRSPTSGV